MQDAFNLNGKLLEINGRIDFTSDSVCDMIGQTRCHSVSQDCIFNLMKCIINGFINGGCSIDDAVEMLHDFEKVVFPYTINIDEYYCVGLIRKGRQQRSAFHETVEKLKEITQTDILEYTNNLARQANNSVLNLRSGNSNWNSSVSYSFDPTSWIYATGDGGGCCESGLMNTPLDMERGIYLNNALDRERILNIMPLISKCNQMDLFDYEFGTDMYSMGNYIVVGSSSNTYEKTSDMIPIKDGDIAIYCGDMQLQ